MTDPTGYPKTGLFHQEEVQLALGNKELPPEALDDDVTPTGMHYVMTHFDTPRIAAATWKLEVGGLVGKPITLTLDDLQKMPQTTIPVTLECAGNGRANMRPRPTGMPWTSGAVSTARWSGTSLSKVLTRAGGVDSSSAVEVVFFGVDQGIEDGQLHTYARSLPVAEALRREVVLAHQMNAYPLPREHGYPLRLVVPDWYGMASVKWLTRIAVLDQPFHGPQQRAYRYRQSDDDPGQPVDLIRVRSLVRPPGVPDYLTRIRVVEAGCRRITGRAWSGGAEVVRVDFSADNGATWTVADLERPVGKYAWRGWSVRWDAVPGEHVLCSRATDAEGNTQPLSHWNSGGFGGNMIHRVAVRVVSPQVSEIA